jgi:glycosyltransferase involved in cell wall biosynthesis
MKNKNKSITDFKFHLPIRQNLYQGSEIEKNFVNNFVVKDNATSFFSTNKYISSILRSDFSQKNVVEAVSKNIGVIVPCYNEAKRLKIDSFKKFISENSQYILCFVNDGSKDSTFDILERIRGEFPSQVVVIDCKKNVGKAEAVRAGVNYLKKIDEIKYIGFLDADLSTDFDDFVNISEVLKKSKFKIVSGSRIVRMGANIVKESSRGIISKSINLLICVILGMNFQDTQCGAKIMTKDMVEAAFQKPFLTRWLFDVEIFMRMRNFYGKEKSVQYICEQPLNRWVHEDDSKLGFKDSIKIVFQLFQIAVTY